MFKMNRVSCIGSSTQVIFVFAKNFMIFKQKI